MNKNLIFTSVVLALLASAFILSPSAEKKD